MLNLSRRDFLALSAAAMAPAAAWAKPKQRTPPPFLVKLLVPAYIYPSPGAWDAYIDAHDPAHGVEVVLIADPSDGDFTAEDPNYTTAINACAAAGLTVLGYMHTSYGTRHLRDVETNVASWLDIYPQIDGFFVDEQAPTHKLSYYQRLFSFIRGELPGAFIVSNPGVICDVRFLENRGRKMADVVVVYENNDGSSPFSGFSLPADFLSLGPDRVAALIYNVPELDYITGPDSVRTKDVGFVFVTDLTGDSPYGGVPSYWTSDEVPAISITNGF
jgi:hypothetical protein